MVSITINHFPAHTDFFSYTENVSMMQCISPMLKNWIFSLSIEWKYINDRLLVDLLINSEISNLERVIAASIESLLNSYQFRFEKTYTNIPRRQFSNGYELTISNNNSGKFNSNQLFSILSYLRQTNSSLSYTLFFRGGIIQTSNILVITDNLMSPWGIIEGFELDAKVYRISNSNHSIPIDYNVASKLLSLPISYPGLSNIIFGYNHQALIGCKPGENGAAVVGRIHNSPSGEMLTLKPKDFSYMTAVWGVPGQGKSVLSMSLIIQLWKNRIPTLVIEPSKHEYRALANMFPDDVKVVRQMSDFNILMPPDGVDYLAWSEVVMNLLNIACKLPDDSALLGYYREAYLLNSVQDDFSEPRITPLRMLKCYDHIMKKENFGANNKDFVKAGRSRLESFFTYFNGRNWNTNDFKIKTFNIKSLLNVPVIIELSSISTPKMKSAWVYFILQHLYAHIQQRQSESDVLRNLLVLEEAHNILRTNMNPDVLSNVANILAEARALQLGVLISDQSPKTLEPNCISMAQNVFSFKIVDEEDRHIISASTDCDAAKLIKISKRNCIARTNFMNETNCVEVISDYANIISQPVKLKESNYI